MKFEVTIKRVIEVDAESYDAAEIKAFEILLSDETLTLNEVFDIGVKKIPETFEDVIFSGTN